MPNCTKCGKETDRNAPCFNCFSDMVRLFPVCNKCGKKTPSLVTYYVRNKMIQACLSCHSVDSTKKTYSKTRAKVKADSSSLFRQEMGTMAIQHGKSREDIIPYLGFDYKPEGAVGSIMIFKVISAPEKNNRTFNDRVISGDKCKIYTGIFSDENFGNYFYKGNAYVTDAPFISIIKSSVAINKMTKMPQWDKGYFCVYILEGTVSDNGKFRADYCGFRGDTIDEVYFELQSSGILESLNAIWALNGINIPNFRSEDNALLFLTGSEKMMSIMTKISDIVEANKSNGGPKVYNKSTSVEAKKTHSSVSFESEEDGSNDRQNKIEDDKVPF